MKKYKVKLIFKYSDVVIVEAEDEEDAIEKATAECHGQFKCFFDAKVKVLK